MLVGGCLVAAIYIEKETGENGCKQACLDFSPVFFFGVLRTPAERSSADCRLGAGAFGCRRFCCGKNERISRCGAG